MMHQILPKPVTSKIYKRVGNKNFRVGLAAMQGWRNDMEDAHVVELSLENHPDSGFFAVYDGHGGRNVSNYLRANLHPRVDELKDIHSKREITDTVLHLDSDLEKSAPNSYEYEGSTACFACITKEETTYKLTIGNVGDSRAVLITRRAYKPIVALTKDHKPSNKKEKERIKKAGGTVVDDRVGGVLSVSRAFGDVHWKTPKNNTPQTQMVTSIPDYTVTTATTSEFLFLGCDGIFENDAFTIKSLGTFINASLDQTDDLALICGHVLDNCLSRGSFDNMTAILIQLNNGVEYHREAELYWPGIYYVGANLEVYQRAYAEDAARAGYTLRDAINLHHHLITQKNQFRIYESRTKESRKSSDEPSSLRPSFTTTTTTSTTNKKPDLVTGSHPGLPRVPSGADSRIRREPLETHLSPRNIRVVSGVPDRKNPSSLVTPPNSPRTIRATTINIKES